METQTQMLPKALDNGRFVFIRKIGEGGYAKVGLYHDGKENYDIVIKAYSLRFLGQDDIERLKREEIVLRYLRHPYIVKCYGSIQTQEGLFVIYEYVEGKTLQQFLECLYQGEFSQFAEVHGGKPHLQLSIVDYIAQQLFETLAALHSMSIAHRDIKPENIIFDTRKIRITLIDFGAAKNQVQMGSVTTYIGTHYFMSPYFFTGKTYTVKTDVWSCGATIFWLLSNYLPFGEVFNFKRVIYGAHDKLPDFVPNKTKTMIYDCLYCEEVARFSSVDVLKAYFPYSRELRSQNLAQMVELTSTWTVYVRAPKDYEGDAFLSAEKQSQIRMANNGVIATCNFVFFVGKSLPRCCKYCLNLYYEQMQVFPFYFVFERARPDCVAEKGANVMIVQNELDIVEFLLNNRYGEIEKVYLDYCEYTLPKTTCMRCCAAM